MKLDKMILDRFNELESQANDIDATTHQERYMGGARRAVDIKQFHEWATSAMGLLERVFGKDTAHYQNFADGYSKCAGWKKEFHKCWGVLIAAASDYKGGYILHFKALVSAEVLDDTLEQASALLKSGYKDPACVVAGVALETTLKQLCTKNGLSHAKLDKMNADLCKAGVYNMSKQKQITAWAELRNNAAHGKWDAYNKNDIVQMIKEVGRFIADYLN